ncbi:hypothetical protein DQ04_08421010 [Trypanosoma grayi]|uniref:hypothetical protein n=1 Tax=Trypanosoma grayi TaxID=71804 RepID=UPI0004F43538|nr:hypothetical protein DQ04_08421010 [Trypanosoma grayi]KEG07941.1 hypothetical protein DQ04_08421010 [Trypanosoma grayi]
MMATVRRVVCVLTAALCCTALCVAAEPQQEPLEKYDRRAELHSGGVPSSRYAVLSAAVQVSPAGSGAVKAVEASMSPQNARAALLDAVGLSGAAKNAVECVKTKAAAAKVVAAEALSAATEANTTTSAAYEALNKLNGEVEAAVKKEPPSNLSPDLQQKIAVAAQKANDAVGKTKKAHETCTNAAGVSSEAETTAKTESAAVAMIEEALRKVKEAAETFPDAKKRVSEVGKSAASAIDDAKKAHQHATAALERANEARDAAGEAHRNAKSAHDFAKAAEQLRVTTDRRILSSQEQVTKALPEAEKAMKSAQDALTKAEKALEEATKASEHADTVHKIAVAIEDAVQQAEMDARKPAVSSPNSGGKPDSVLHTRVEERPQPDPSQAGDVRNGEPPERNPDKHTAAAVPSPAGKNGGEPKVETGSPIASPLKQSEDHHVAETENSKMEGSVKPSGTDGMPETEAGMADPPAAQQATNSGAEGDQAVADVVAAGNQLRDAGSADASSSPAWVRAPLFLPLLAALAFLGVC